MRRALILCAGVLLLLPATAAAIQITKHKTTRDPLTHKVIHAEWTVDVAPQDSDDDGCRNSEDDYNGPGCKPPPPPPEPAPAPATASAAVTAAPAPAPTSVPTTSAGGCPSYMAGEASSPSAVNPSSGASGCYQVLPSTAAAMGSACADVNASSCVAAICASAGNAAWASSGATPCDYVRP